MSSIRISEHSKSFANLGVQIEINKSNKTTQIGAIEYCSYGRRAVLDLARSKPYELPGPREQI